MTRESIILGILSLSFVATVLVAYVKSTSVQSQDVDTQQVPQSRHLALQPEAFKLTRRIGGERFKLKIPPALLIQGVITTATGRQTVQIARHQNASGERVEVSLAGSGAVFSWDATRGARMVSGLLNVTERTLLERLIFDSVDQFILAQLRGASYYVVARNVRPNDAPDNYAGAVWDVVRIDDPETNEQKQLLSRWRLYYVNNTTGLIDKIVSESRRERIEANLSDWRERAGEMCPSTITWTSQGRTVMTFNLTNVSLAAQ